MLLTLKKKVQLIEKFLSSFPPMFMFDESCLGENYAHEAYWAVVQLQLIFDYWLPVTQKTNRED